MSILSRFAKFKGPEQSDVSTQQQECAHTELAPRWDSVADMGIKDKVVSYACTACGETLSPDVARERSAS